MSGGLIPQADGGSSGQMLPRIDVYQSGALVRHTRRLAEETERAEDNSMDVGCFATATFLTGIAAVEGMLSEFVHINNRSLYTSKFLKLGIAEKYAQVTGQLLADDAPEVVKLQAARNALVHSEPENVRSKDVGLLLNRHGARWATTTVDAFARLLWGNRMPRWFQSDTGL